MRLGAGREDSLDVALVDSPASIRAQDIPVDEVGNQVWRTKADRRRLIRGERHPYALARGAALVVDNDSQPRIEVPRGTRAGGGARSE